MGAQHVGEVEWDPASGTSDTWYGAPLEGWYGDPAVSGPDNQTYLNKVNF